MTQSGLAYALPFLHLGHFCCFLVEQTLWCYWACVLLSWVQNSPWFQGMDNCHKYFALTAKEVWLLPCWSVSFEEILNVNDGLFISSLPLSPPCHLPHNWKTGGASHHPSIPGQPAPNANQGWDTKSCFSLETESGILKGSRNFKSSYSKLLNLLINLTSLTSGTRVDCRMLIITFVWSQRNGSRKVLDFDHAFAACVEPGPSPQWHPSRHLRGPAGNS